MVFVYSFYVPFLKELWQRNPRIEAQKDPKASQKRKSKLVLFVDMMSFRHFLIFQAGAMLISLRSVSILISYLIISFPRFLEAFLRKGFDWKS